jgi:hypothetical protein
MVYTSGRPVAILVRIERIPESSEVLPTVSQSTSEITAVVPMVATAVWQIVRRALMPAAFQNSLPIVYYLLIDGAVIAVLCPDLFNRFSGHVEEPRVIHNNEMFLHNDSSC